MLSLRYQIRNIFSNKMFKIGPSFTRTMSKKDVRCEKRSYNRLQGKVAIVTASTAGIGFAIARRLGREGAKVVVSSRKPEHVECAVKTLQEEKLDVDGVVCNVTKATDRTKLIQRAICVFGKIDILVSNAGTNLCFGPLFDCDEKQWDKMFETNVKSAFFLAKECAPHLKCSDSGRIIFVSSIAGYVPLPAIGIYSITKTALLGLTKTIADELTPDGVTVNCVAPGIIKTKFSSALIEEPTISSQILKATPMGRFGCPDEVAALVAYFASDDSSYISGETVVVAGGMPSRL